MTGGLDNGLYYSGRGREGERHGALVSYADEQLKKMNLENCFVSSKAKPTMPERSKNELQCEANNPGAREHRV